MNTNKPRATPIPPRAFADRRHVRLSEASTVVISRKSQGQGLVGIPQGANDIRAAASVAVHSRARLRPLAAPCRIAGPESRTGSPAR